MALRPLPAQEGSRPLPMPLLLWLPTGGLLMAIIWGRDRPEHSTSKLDDAIDRGFDPHEDQGGQPVDRDAPLPPHIVRRNHQAAPVGCEGCGGRCEICGDRMCTRWGPAPLVRCSAHPTCEDCDEATPCRDCNDAIKEAAA